MAKVKILLDNEWREFSCRSVEAESGSRVILHLDCSPTDFGMDRSGEHAVLLNEETMLPVIIAAVEGADGGTHVFLELTEE